MQHITSRFASYVSPCIVGAFCIVAMTFLPNCSAQQSNSSDPKVTDERMPPSTNQSIENPQQLVSTKTAWSIAIHGGAGGDMSRWTDTQKKVRIDGLRAALKRGTDLLESGSSAVDVVQAVVQVLEDDPNFNAGRGAVLNSNGDVSLDAAIMDGSDLSCGAVANVATAKNPVQLARAVRDKTPHVLLCGDPADQFAKEQGIAQEPQSYFKTPEQMESWNVWKKKQAERDSTTSNTDHNTGKDRLFYLGTVGCVARDQHGNLAAATSTGGLLGKRYGRVGDSPIIGAGTYAKNQTCAISCTGVGELFIKNHIATAVSSRMEYLNESLEQATKHAIHQTLPEDSGGLIAVNSAGDISLVFNTPVMARGQAKSDGTFQVGLVDLVK
jgi:beta-aspartyl-peptidase (threonine type)